MSWAIPGQGGWQHINKHTNAYIIEKMEKLGFKYNKEVTEKYKAQFKNWFKNTLMVFDKIQIPLPQQTPQVPAKADYVVYPSKGHVPPNPTLVAILKKYYKEKNVKSIVDFGCGECKLIAVLKDAGFEVRGVDATPYTNASYV